MRRLSERETLEKIAFLERSAEFEKDWETVHSDYTSREARIEFPLGELMNPKIIGYVWAWRMQDAIGIERLSGKERFKAQALEGKVSIKTDFVTALLVYRNLPRFRRSVLVKRGKMTSPRKKIKRRLYNFQLKDYGIQL